MTDPHHRATDDASGHAIARDPRRGVSDADPVSDTALALLTLDELRARVRELYEGQRTVERERDVLRDDQRLLLEEPRSALPQRNDADAPPHAAPVARPNGLTHDINNMLGVIIGHVGMALKDVRESDPLRPDLVAIQNAAERAADLIRELRNANAGMAAPAAVAPVSPPAARVERAAAPASEAGTVLLVEDEPAILTLVTHVLRGQGYTVLRSNSANEALATAQAHPGPIDLLLTDVMMPEMNGRDLSRALRSTHPGLRTVFMSGFTADLLPAHGSLDGDAAYLQKPFSIDALTATVQKALTPAP
jgi:CheY-like chemotaxis protein